MTRAEVWTAPVAYHGEGPIWLASEGALLWVDMMAGDILRSSDGVNVTRHHVGDVAAVVRARSRGGYVAALERSIALLDPQFEVERDIPLWSDPSVRLNEGACDSYGRFYCGSMAYDAREGGASMYRLDSDLQVSKVLDDLTVSNGLVWAPDGSVAYYIDTAEQRIDQLRFDPTSGDLTDRREIVRIDPGLGGPDGMTIDSDGNLWVALWDGKAVHSYSPKGELVHVVNLPIRRVTACTFGGENYGTLFITTSRFELDDPEPDAGAVYVADAGVHGVAPFEFGG